MLAIPLRRSSHCGNKQTPFRSCLCRFPIRSAPGLLPTWRARMATSPASPTSNSSMVGKWIELLKEIAPGVARVAFLFNPQTAPYVTRYYQGPLETSARSLGLQASASPVDDASEMESALIAFTREPGGGLIVMPDSFNIVHRNQIIAQGLPAGRGCHDCQADRA